METCTVLGLLHNVSDTNTQVNTVSGQDMGIVGHVMVTFKLGKQSFTHKFLVCRFLTRPFILGEDYLSKNCMRMEWDGNKRANFMYEQHFGDSFTGSNGGTIETL